MLTVSELPAFHTDVSRVSLVSSIPLPDCASQPIDLFAVSMSQTCETGVKISLPCLAYLSPDYPIAFQNIGRLHASGET